MIAIDYIKHQFEFDNKKWTHIQFSILSKNQNNDRYTDSSSVPFSLCDVNEAWDALLLLLSLHLG